MWPCLGLPRYLVSALNALQTVEPILLGFLASRQRNWQPFQASSIGRPRCLRYQPLNLPGSLALKNTPPIPEIFCRAAMGPPRVVDPLLSSRTHNSTAHRSLRRTTGRSPSSEGRDVNASTPRAPWGGAMDKGLAETTLIAAGIRP